MMNRLEEKFRKIAISQGYTVLGNGWPDFLLKMEDGLKAIEVKGPNDKLRENQIEMLRALDDAGLKCYVYQQMNSEAEAHELIPIEELLHEKNKRVQTNWRNNWKDGMDHLHSGVKNLKEIGMSDKEVLLHVKRILSSWSRKDLFRL
jgi:hypothetical protein